jgi:hypothetical protein
MGPASSPVATRPEQDERLRLRFGTDGDLCAHNPKVAGSNPAPATNLKNLIRGPLREIGEGLFQFPEQARKQHLYNTGQAEPSGGFGEPALASDS